MLNDVDCFGFGLVRIFSVPHCAVGFLNSMDVSLLVECNVFPFRYTYSGGSDFDVVLDDRRYTIYTRSDKSPSWNSDVLVRVTYRT